MCLLGCRVIDEHLLKAQNRSDPLLELLGLPVFGRSRKPVDDHFAPAILTMMSNGDQEFLSVAAKPSVLASVSKWLKTVRGNVN